MPDDVSPKSVQNDNFAKILADERVYIDAWRVETDRSKQPRLTGLALSGGGIRSAVYCLGVLQAFAKYEILQRFDYLSTVSGGGYIGSSLTWCTSKIVNSKLQEGVAPFGVLKDNLPFDIDDPLVTKREPARANSLLRHLRGHGSYLLPGHGIDMVSGIAVVLRGLLLNLAIVWLPIITVIFAFTLLMQGLLGSVGSMAEIIPWLHPLAIGGYCAAIFALWSMVYSLRSRRLHIVPGRGVSYATRRWFEIYARPLLWIAAGSLVLGSLPAVTGALQGKFIQNGGVLGSAMAAAGALSGLWSRFVPRGSVAARVPGWVGPTGAALVFYGIGLLAYWLADQWVFHGIAAVASWSVLEKAVGPTPSTLIARCLMAVPLLVSLLVGWWVDLNYITLHRYYRDRLMEAFMPDFTAAGIPHGPAATAAEAGRLQDMCDVKAAAGPYHVLNAHMVITHVDDGVPPGTTAQAAMQLRDAANRVRLRGGDSFILSPLYCGSKVTGWQPTSSFMSGKLTLSTAMAVSGAAVNPDAASAGVGPQRNRMFAELMALLNLRLGFWAPNPRKPDLDPTPNHFIPGLSGCIDRLTSQASLLELTDGGNFENLGVYELLRRNVGIIVVCDADADPDFAFADLQTLLSRAEADFLVQINFILAPVLGALMPRQQPVGSYPNGALLSNQPFAVATITYNNGTEGRLFYLKAALTPALRLQLLGYKGANPEFPDDPTIDQFYSEARFEAYRELGFASAQAMLSDPTIWPIVATM